MLNLKFYCIAIAVIIASVLSGCKSSSPLSIEMEEWSRFSKIEGCVSFISSHGEPHDFNIKLKPNLEAELLLLLRGKEIKSPLCWYEKPNGNIFLNAGEYCGFPKEAYFQKKESGWVLNEFKEVHVQCDLKQK